MNNNPVHSQNTSTERQKLLASVPDAALLVDNQGTILAVNAESTRLFGYTVEELLGTSLEKLLPERFQMVHKQHMAEYFRNPWPRPMGLNLDLVARHKQAHEIDIRVSLSPWQSTQDPLVVAFIRDITAQKALETAVRQARDHLEQEVEARTAELRQTNQQLREEIVERQRIEEELRTLTAELTRRHDQLKHELQSLEKFSQSTPSAITARAFNLLSLAESLPEIFASLVGEYGTLLDTALESRTYRVEDDLAEKLRLLAEKLGTYHAGPHDVVLLHSQALKTKVAGIPYPKSSHYFEEGRLLVLKLMGYLAAYYRGYSLPFWQNKPNSNRMAQDNAPTARED